ncbi:peptidoglycan editing factor PgeF [Virgibacillus byunsanensis]|uniref:Purine nucleoside phosphorylase n=1 Tax=Virgibacillus byunsanensis TaxID=570945 RepID=A0ABW3LJT3_9BACI
MADLFYQDDISFLHIEKWQRMNERLKVGFTTRNGGVSKAPFHSLNFGLHVSDHKAEVIANRELLANKLKLPLESWVSGEQTHKTNIKIISQEDKGKGSVDVHDALKDTDGLITNKPGIACTAFFADCVPLYFFDPITGYIGIAHAGWKGTVNRIAEQMIQTFKNVGADPTNILVAIGPCISQEAYEVDENVIHYVDDNLRSKVAIPKENNRYLLDLKQLNVEILLQYGILRNNIDVTKYCTLQHNHLFFSHRRDNGKTGRMLGYIGYST